MGLAYDVTRRVYIDPMTGAPEDGPVERVNFGPIRTESVQSIDGHLGQVLVGGEIVWESGYHESRDDALTAANNRVAKRLANLFAHNKRSK